MSLKVANAEVFVEASAQGPIAMRLTIEHEAVSSPTPMAFGLEIGKAVVLRDELDSAIRRARGS